jgi:hypothetical protein
MDGTTMLRTQRFALFLGAAALAAPVAADAQQIRSPYEFVETAQSLGVQFGYAAANTGALDLGPRSGPLATARYVIRLQGPMAVEAEAGFLRAERGVYNLVQDTLLEPPTRIERVGEADVTLLLLKGGLRMHLTGQRTYHNLLPYLVVGGGAVIDLAGRGAADELVTPEARYRFGTSFAGELGAGVDWFLSRQLSLRGDVRNLFWRLDTPDAYLLRDATTTHQQWVRNLTLTAGAAWHF